MQEIFLPWVWKDWQSNREEVQKRRHFRGTLSNIFPFVLVQHDTINIIWLSSFARPVRFTYRRTYPVPSLPLEALFWSQGLHKIWMEGCPLLPSQALELRQVLPHLWPVGMELSHLIIKSIHRTLAMASQLHQQGHLMISIPVGPSLTIQSSIFSLGWRKAHPFLNLGSWGMEMCGTHMTGSRLLIMPLVNSWENTGG